MSLTSAPPAADWTDDAYAAALRTGRGPLFLRRPDGWLLPLDVERWCGRVDGADLAVLNRCRGPVLDIGCGPGRFTTALAARGVPVLGVDLSPVAVARTVAAGGVAECRSVFETLPGEGTWHTVLLMDGNIGIGGDPSALLKRAAELTTPSGRLIVEASPADVDERVAVHVVSRPDAAAPAGAFPWARVGLPALRAHAHATGWTVAETWHDGGRGFLELRA